MRTRYLLALMAETVIAPSAAFAQGNTVGGAIGGAAIGGVVGAGVGGTAGAATEPPEGVVTYVERERVPSVAVREQVGEPLPETVVIHNVPQHDDYAYAVVNNERVIVEPHSRKVIKIIK